MKYKMTSELTELFARVKSERSALADEIISTLESMGLCVESVKDYWQGGTVIIDNSNPMAPITFKVYPYASKNPVNRGE